MKYFSAQYIFTNDGPPLKRGIITTDDEGTVIKVEDTGGEVTERHSLNFYNGIIVPGFVNCHCHLELSYMKGQIPRGTGLGGFLSGVTGLRGKLTDDPLKAIENADRAMTAEGIVLCADICNSTHTFRTKQKSSIRYISLLEVFGIDANAAGKRMAEIGKVAESAAGHGLEWYYVPHSVYSVSLPLFGLLKEKSSSNRVTSVHFMESEDENQLLKNKTGKLMDAYRMILSPSTELKTPLGHVSAITDEITASGSLILVHCTFTGSEEIEKLRKRKDLYYCLCPGSNSYISGKIPPLDLLMTENCDIVIGTDSLSSNDSLSILNELKILQQEYPATTLQELIKFATLNGARALGADDTFGAIRPGMKPGLVLIRDTDLANLKLLPGSAPVRII
jgi:aminodeoxyfutalosine deaminase